MYWKKKGKSRVLEGIFGDFRRKKSKKWGIFEKIERKNEREFLFCRNKKTTSKHCEIPKSSLN
jgi:hypothetical protein